MHTPIRARKVAAARMVARRPGITATEPRVVLAIADFDAGVPRYSERPIDSVPSIGNRYGHPVVPTLRARPAARDFSEQERIAKAVKNLRFATAPLLSEDAIV